MERILVIGYGNPGRQDDGLGPAVAEIIDAMALPGVTVEADYQLTVEDAATIATHDAVVFVDADLRGPGPFSFRRLVPGGTIGFSSHGAEPEALLQLARELFAADRPGFLLGIRGYEFDEYSEQLSRRAQANMASALQFLVPMLRRGSLDGAACPR